MARSRSSNHGAELTYGDEKNCDILRLSQSFCENPIFMWKSRFFRVISLIFCVKRLASLPRAKTLQISNFLLQIQFK